MHLIERPDRAPFPVYEAGDKVRVRTKRTIGGKAYDLDFLTTVTRRSGDDIFQAYYYVKDEATPYYCESLSLAS